MYLHISTGFHFDEGDVARAFPDDFPHDFVFDLGGLLVHAWEHIYRGG